MAHGSIFHSPFDRFMVETDMRPEEICRIRPSYLQLAGDDPYVKIPFGKTKAARRRVPLNPTAVQILETVSNRPKASSYFHIGRMRTSRC